MKLAEWRRLPVIPNPRLLRGSEAGNSYTLMPRDSSPIRLILELDYLWASVPIHPRMWVMASSSGLWTRLRDQSWVWVPSQDERTLPLPPWPQTQQKFLLRKQAKPQSLILQVRLTVARLILTHESQDLCDFSWSMEKQVRTSAESMGK